jgi:hypothetical protein
MFTLYLELSLNKSTEIEPPHKKEKKVDLIRCDAIGQIRRKIVWKSVHFIKIDDHVVFFMLFVLWASLSPIQE